MILNKSTLCLYSAICFKAAWLSSMLKFPKIVEWMVRTNLNDRSIDRPLTFASPNSTRLRRTMTISKQFHLSFRYLTIPSASIFKRASAVNMVVKTCHRSKRYSHYQSVCPHSRISHLFSTQHEIWYKDHSIHCHGINCNVHYQVLF
jgi:hypothetical protein